MEFWIVVGIILFFALIRTPLFLILSAFSIYFFYIAEENLASIIISYTEISKQSILLAIPLFTFAGFVLSESKTPQRLVNLANALFGFLPGGIAIVSLLTCAIFTAFTGASGVTIIALGGLLYPILIQQKYPEHFSLGLMTTSGSLGLLFPPSLPIIVYGIVSQTDISALFKAGILPGILLLFILAFYAIRIGFRNNIQREVFPYEFNTKKYSLKDLLIFIVSFGIFLYLFLNDSNSFFYFLISITSSFIALKTFFQIFFNEAVIKSFNAAKYEVFLPILILSGIYSGQFTPTESAIVTALYVVIVECFIYKDIHFFKELPKITRESMLMVGAILVIMASALAFTNYLIDEEIPDMLLTVIQENIESKLVFLIALNVLLLIVGSIMDIFSAILVVVPLILPIAAEYNVHPVHLGIIFLANLEIGYMTPPVGLNLFISSFRFKKDIITLYKAALPYIVLLIIALLIITYVPELSLFFVD